MGKGRDPNQEKTEHVSRPLATLKDPAAFGPPPKNVNYYGGAALPDRITADTRGLGAPLSQPPAPLRNQAPEIEEEEPSRPAPPPVPYRADTTGLKTNNLPPPPIHRAIAEKSTHDVKPKPGLPPRLPSRTQSTTSTVAAHDSSPPPAYEPVQSPSPISMTPPASTSSTQLNQGAINRLGNAGVSVPGFGIGKKNPWSSEKSQTSTSTTTNAGPQLSELQTRFAKMNTSSSSSPQSETPPQPPAQGTTWNQKQQAMQTAQNFHRDPSSVNAQDARQTASTVNNFRERHSDQIQAGASRAKEWNKKHNFTGRINNFLEKQSSPSSEQPPPNSAFSGGNPAATQPQMQNSEAAQVLNRKPPPPPPPKKPSNMAGHPGAGYSSPPPPVPLGTKPR